MSIFSFGNGEGEEWDVEKSGKIIKDKDFKEQNNYREVEFDSCFNCKYSFDTEGMDLSCSKDKSYCNVDFSCICDKWEHA